MPDGITVPASDFSRHFAKYQDVAIPAKVIHVTNHGRVVGAYLSTEELERYELLKQRERAASTTAEGQTRPPGSSDEPGDEPA